MHVESLVTGDFGQIMGNATRDNVQTVCQQFHVFVFIKSQFINSYLFQNVSA